MSSFTIFETDGFLRDLDRIRVPGHEKMLIKLRAQIYPQLRNEPRYGPNVKKLRGYTPPTWRYRIRDWRFFYEIHEKRRLVIMIAAHHRSEAYWHRRVDAARRPLYSRSMARGQIHPGGRRRCWRYMLRVGLLFFGVDVGLAQDAKHKEIFGVNQTCWQRPMRTAALQYNGEPDPMKVPAVWQEAGFNVEQLLHLVGTGYYGAFDEARHGDKLRKYVQDSRQRGIRIILYLNTHTLRPDHPREDWAVQKPVGGAQKMYETWQAGCGNTGWADWMVDGVARAMTYGVDGIFSDGPVPIVCWCPKCRELFEKRFGYAMPNEPTVQQKKDMDRMAFDTSIQLQGRLYEAVKKANPQAICYQNINLHSGHVEEYLPYNDFVGTEGGFMFYGPPKNGYLWKPSLAAREAEAYSRGKPTIIFAAGDQKSWSRYLHAPGETKLMFAASVANGANVWYGLHCPTHHLKEPGGRAAVQTNRFMAAHEDLLAGTEPAASVAILHSNTTFAQYKAGSETTDLYGQSAAASGLGDARQSLQGFASMLLSAQVPFKVISEADLSPKGLAGVDCLILPTVGCLSDGQAKAITEYVRGGGNLVATLDSSLFDEQGRRRQDFTLHEVLGVSAQDGSYDFKDYNYYEIAPDAPLAGFSPVRLQPAPSIGMKVKLAGAKMVGQFRGVQSGRYVEMEPLATPAITVNELGKGHALYLAGNFGEFYEDFRTLEYRQLLVAALREWCKPMPVVENAPESLEIVVRRQAAAGRLIVHLINYTGGMSRPIQQVVPLSGVMLRLPGSHPRARLVAAGREVRSQPAPGYSDFTLDLPSEWEILVVEPGQ